jgi:hypothetical protein
MHRQQALPVALQVYALAAETACDESLDRLTGTYRGCPRASRSGRQCQRWRDQVPHTHVGYSYGAAALDDGTGDFCRKPDDSHASMWCHTTDAGVRWEYCDPVFNDPAHELLSMHRWTYVDPFGREANTPSAALWSAVWTARLNTLMRLRIIATGDVAVWLGSCLLARSAHGALDELVDAASEYAECGPWLMVTCQPRRSLGCTMHLEPLAGVHLPSHCS